MGMFDDLIPTGDDYLKTRSPDDAATIKGLAAYKINPQSLSIKGGHRERLIGGAIQYDKDYDQAAYPARAAAIKEFASGGPNAPAGQITAGSTAIQHLAELNDISKKLGGTNNAWIFNAPINWANANVESLKNNPDLVAYKGALDRFTEEATKFYRGVGGTEADIKRAIENLTAGQSPEARTAAIQEQAKLMASKINALQDRFKTALGPKGWLTATEGVPQFPIIQGKTEKALEQILKIAEKGPEQGAAPSATPGQPAAPAAAPAIAAPDAEGWITLPSGNRIRETPKPEPAK